MLFLSVQKNVGLIGFDAIRCRFVIWSLGGLVFPIGSQWTRSLEATESRCILGRLYRVPSDLPHEQGTAWPLHTWLC